MTANEVASALGDMLRRLASVAAHQACWLGSSVASASSRRTMLGRSGAPKQCSMAERCGARVKAGSGVRVKAARAVTPSSARACDSAGMSA
jgi:hypothetical protein